MFVGLRGGVEHVCGERLGQNLNQAWDAVLAGDERVRAAEWQVSASRQGLSAARGEFGPTASATLEYDARDKEEMFQVAVPGGTMDLPTTQRTGATTNVTISQPLYTFGHIRADIDAAKADVCVESSVLNQTVEEVKLKVVDAYMEVLLSQRRVEVAKAAEESLASHTKDVRNRFQQGMAIDNALLASEVALANAQQKTLGDLNLLANARSAYNRALVRPLDAPVQLDEVQNRPSSRTWTSSPARPSSKDRNSCDSLAKLSRYSPRPPASAPPIFRNFPSWEAISTNKTSTRSTRKSPASESRRIGPSSIPGDDATSPGNWTTRPSPSTISGPTPSRSSHCRSVTPGPT